MPPWSQRLSPWLPAAPQGCDHKRESELICDRKARIVSSNDRGDLIVFVRRRDHRVSDTIYGQTAKKRRGSRLIDRGVTVITKSLEWKYERASDVDSDDSLSYV